MYASRCKVMQYHEGGIPSDLATTNRFMIPPQENDHENQLCMSSMFSDAGSPEIGIKLRMCSFRFNVTSTCDLISWGKGFSRLTSIKCRYPSAHPNHTIPVQEKSSSHIKINTTERELKQE